VRKTLAVAATGATALLPERRPWCHSSAPSSWGGAVDAAAVYVLVSAPVAEILVAMRRPAAGLTA